MPNNPLLTAWKPDTRSFPEHNVLLGHRGIYQWRDNIFTDPGQMNQIGPSIRGSIMLNIGSWKSFLIRPHQTTCNLEIFAVGVEGTANSYELVPKSTADRSTRTRLRALRVMLADRLNRQGRLHIACCSRLAPASV